MSRSPERPNGWILVAIAVYLAGTVAVVAWGLRLEQPYACKGRHNCGPEVVR